MSARYRIEILNSRGEINGTTYITAPNAQAALHQAADTIELVDDELFQVTEVTPS